MNPLIFAALFLLSRQSLAHYNPHYHIHQITAPVSHAEGPHWKEDEHALYYVDISGFGVHRYEPFSEEHTFVTLRSTVGAIVPIEGHSGKFVIGYGTNISVLTWDGHSKEYSIENKFEVDKGKIGNRFNDGKADPKGRLWIGTMGEEKPTGEIQSNQGTLYKVAKNCELSSMVAPVTISNGLAWSHDSSKMFYIDSPTRKIDVFDYNNCNGKISNRKLFFSLMENNITGVPDGMTIDEEDNLWIAIFGGSKVIKVSPRGEVVQSIPIPAERVTSVAWGGLDYDTLFVTTMKKGLSESQLRKQPSAGAVFKVVGLEAKGRPASSTVNCILQLPTLH